MAYLVGDLLFANSYKHLSGKTLLSKAAISVCDSFEKIACSLNLSERSVY